MLSDLLARSHKGPLSNLLTDETVLLGWDLRLKWARESAEAINYLHNLDPKIIHRDLKYSLFLVHEVVHAVCGCGVEGYCGVQATLFLIACARAGLTTF